jgi:hypothetical protein
VHVVHAKNRQIYHVMIYFAAFSLVLAFYPGKYYLLN